MQLQSASFILLTLLLAGPGLADDNLERLIKAYPGQLCGADGNDILWCDGSKMPYDDGNREKTRQQREEQADIQDQMELRYPAGRDYAPPTSDDDDPGRIRNEAFFKKMYGQNAIEAGKRLRPVIWLPQTLHKRVMMTGINGVDQKLQAVSDELDRLPDSLKHYLDKPAGTFMWRSVGREKRLSPHSFGIAIDINLKGADYWLWTSHGGTAPPYRNRIPLEIVEVFEKHGFIWGGKWRHYDTLHFEYRPELLGHH